MMMYCPLFLKTSGVVTEFNPPEFKLTEPIMFYADGNGDNYYWVENSAPGPHTGNGKLCRDDGTSWSTAEASARYTKNGQIDLSGGYYIDTNWVAPVNIPWTMVGAYDVITSVSYSVYVLRYLGNNTCNIYLGDQDTDFSIATPTYVGVSYTPPVTQWKIYEEPPSVILLSNVTYAMDTFTGTPNVITVPNVIITTDIGGDVDDQQSLVYALMYSSDVNIRGIISTGSTDNSGRNSFPLITDALTAYALVEDNLRLHNSAFPTAAYLTSKSAQGSSFVGYAEVGVGKDTNGSNLIVSEVDAMDLTDTMYIQMWGAQTELAQALYRVKTDRSTVLYDEFVSKIQIHDISDQTAMFSTLIVDHPNLKYVLNIDITVAKTAAFRGMYLGGDESTITETWLDANVRGNGALTVAAVFPKADSVASDTSAYLGIKAGDNASLFANICMQGLSDASDPTQGGWGGRYLIENGNTHYTCGSDAIGANADDVARATMWRWRPHYQNEFAARLQWCENPVATTFHRPVAYLNSDSSTDILTTTINIGDTVSLSAVGSMNPDASSLSYNWWIYDEAGTSGATTPIITGQTTDTASFTAPDVGADNKTLHVILEVTNNGTIPVTSYRRLIVTVTGSASASAIDNFIVIGASIMLQAMDSTLLKSSIDTTYSVNSNVHNEAVSGWSTGELKAGVDSILATYSAYSNAVVLIHIGGNNVSDNRPYSTDTQLATMEQDIRDIIASVVTAGFTPVLADLTYRDYPTNFETEDLGSLPYNDNMINPLAVELCGDYIFADNTSLADFYTVMYNGQTTHFEADGVHPNATGEAALRDQFMDSIVKFNYLGVKPTKLIKNVSTDIVWVNLSEDNAVSPVATGEYVNNALCGGDTGVFVPFSGALMDINNIPTAITFTVPDEFAGANITGVVTGNDSGVVPDSMLSNSWYLGLAGSNTTTGTVSIGGLDDAKEYKITLGGSRAISDADRVGNYTVGGVSLTLDAAQNSTNEIEFNNVSPIAGAINIDVIREGVSAWAYLGWVKVENVANLADVTAGLIHKYSLNTDATDSIGSFASTVSGDVSFNSLEAVFAGVNGSIDVLPATTSITRNFTFSCWYNATSGGADYALFTKVVDGSEKELLIRHDATLERIFIAQETGNNGFEFASANQTALNDQWNHVVVTVSSAMLISIYVNGTFLTSTTATGEPSVSIYPGVLGKLGGTYNVNYFKGSLDEVRMYNRAVDAGEVTTIYNNELPLHP